MNMMIAKWGNSLGVRIPNAVAKEAGLGLGASVQIVARKGRITIEPAPYDLASMIRAITPDNRHAAVTTGTPVGKEIW